MHWFKRNIGDYHKKAGRLSILQHGVYMLLMDACYDREEFPTKEQAYEWVWASTQSEVDAVNFVLNRFFTEENGLFIQHRIRHEINAYQEKCDKNKRIANERETNRRNLSTNRSPVDNESSPNQEPRTKNHNKDVAEVINHLNAVVGSKYKLSAKTHAKHINARLSEGHHVNDLKMVIDFKNKEWGGDSSMAQYLRPSTIFGDSKFNGYLSAAKASKPKPSQTSKQLTSFEDMLNG